MTTAYMSQWEIQTLAEEALTSFEMTASWQSAAIAAIEFAADEWEIKATAAQVATGWQGIAMSVKKVVYAPQH